MHFVLLRMTEAVWGAALSLDPKRLGKIERLERSVKDVNPHVAQRAAAEIENLPPLAGVIHLIDKRTNRSSAEPEIPIKRFGDGRFLCVRAAVVAPVFE